MTCQHLRVRPDRDGKVRVRQNRSYLCTVKIPWPDLPNSVWMANRALPTPGHVEPKQCDGCLYYQRREA